MILMRLNRARQSLKVQKPPGLLAPTPQPSSINHPQGFRNGFGADVKFNSPAAVEYLGGDILVADKGNSLLRFIDAATDEVRAL